jgi:outer membrane protein assembly factor BamB
MIRRGLFLALAGALCAPAVAEPDITGLNRTECSPSGRVVISGSGFGQGGTVRIAGLDAWTTTWTDERIVAFVPEGAPLGIVPLEVIVGSERSHEVELTVTSRTADGRVRWTFEADSDNLWYRPALGADGTIYLHGSQGFVYALSADGGLKWTRKVDWYPYVPPMTGPDGTLFVGTLDLVYAISPAGEILWQFRDPDAQHIQVAATPGPGGLLYGAFDVGMGAFALDPATGERQWSNTGDPRMIDQGNPFGTEVRFGPSRPGGPIDQMYVHMDWQRVMYAFSLDGEQRFTTPVSGTISHEPVVGSDGTIYIPHFGAAHGWGIQAIEPGRGDTRWIYSPENGNGISEIEISADDTLYFVTPGRLEAVDGRSASQRWINRHFLVLGWPSLSPDGSLIVVDGVPTYGETGFIKGYDASNGEELWNIDLPGDPYPGSRVLGIHHARFTPDGRTAYLSTLTVESGDDPHSFLYAMATDGGCARDPEWVCDGDVDGNGAVNPVDVGLIQAAFGSADPRDLCNYDLDCNDAINPVDAGLVQSLFGTCEEPRASCP